jgi:MerR family transcriptional regulator/heat shock protein HspR
MIFDETGEGPPVTEEMRLRPVYFIGVVAEMTEVHPQTLRHYERIGLLLPSRSSGNVRMFSQVDIERVRLIQRLTGQLGVNLAGVEVILNMRDRYEVQRDEHRRQVDRMRTRYEAEVERLRSALQRMTREPTTQPREDLDQS